MFWFVLLHISRPFYDLRTTFYSRCLEGGVADIAQRLFVGHSLGELGNAYTDVSDEYLLKEGKKLRTDGFYSISPFL